MADVLRDGRSLDMQVERVGTETRVRASLWATPITARHSNDSFPPASACATASQVLVDVLSAMQPPVDVTTDDVGIAAPNQGKDSIQVSAFFSFDEYPGDLVDSLYKAVEEIRSRD